MIVGHPRQISPFLTHDHRIAIRYRAKCPIYPVRFDRFRYGSPRMTHDRRSAGVGSRALCPAVGWARRRGAYAGSRGPALALPAPPETTGKLLPRRDHREAPAPPRPPEAPARPRPSGGPCPARDHRRLLPARDHREAPAPPRPPGGPCPARDHREALAPAETIGGPLPRPRPSGPLPGRDRREAPARPRPPGSSCPAETAGKLLRRPRPPGSSCAGRDRRGLLRRPRPLEAGNRSC